ncbi:MAG: DNA repair protein RecN [Chloroflexota bacterium]|nr:DNA repair protein RecN [Chloroflexota bacterium]
MLVELSIQNIAIIDRLRVTFEPTLNALTGETGAGKSIIIDALGAVVGGRTSPDMLRSGEERARIEAVFDVTDRTDPALRAVLDEAGIEHEDGTLILSRDLQSNGRSVARINGQTVTVGLLGRVGERLVDIHGQSAHLSLLRPATHLDFLDAYAGLMERRAELATLVHRVRQIRVERAALEQDDRELARRTDLLRFQVDEIASADLEADEDEVLRAERTRLSNASNLQVIADTVYRTLREGTPPRGTSVVEGLRDVAKNLGELAKLDPALAEAESEVDEMVYLLEDVSATVRTYRDTVEDNPARLAEVEERLTLIRDLERKYGGTVAEVLAFGDEAERELAMLEGSEERLAQLRDEEMAVLRQIGTRAGKLSLARQKAATRLAKAVEAEITHLAMGRTRFTVLQTQEEDAEGAPVGGDDGHARYLAFDARGVDRVEFLIAPNAGEAPKPLARIASGGETARLMLALKSVLAAADATPTLVFDEVDVGIGGRSGQVVGETLAALAHTHQVLCITHLAQVAAFADGHFRIIKRDVRGRTISDVERLDEPERIEELAAMLDGVPITPVARASARDLAERAAARKATTETTRQPAAD